ncbi:MAG: TonB-dependent receptor plug domain-containing protein, partial [Candidatus Methylomirabilales bacterium]
PSAIMVITTEEIRQSGATTIPDLLRSVPGVDVARTTASDVNVTARGLNGFTANRMQLLIDGRLVSEELTGTLPWHQLPISLEEIERIEIVKSPASALYGDRAFGGIVHIITKSPEALKGISLSATGGDSGTALGSLIYADVVGKLRYKVSIGYDRTNQFPNPLTGISSDQEGRENFLGHFLISYQLGERSEVSLSGGINRFQVRDTPFEVSRSLGEGGLGFVKVNYRLAGFRAQYVFHRLDSQARGSDPIGGSTLADSHQIELQHSVDVGERNILTGGMSYRLNTFDSTVLLGVHRAQHLFGLFLQDEYSPFDNLTATVGVRIDTHPEAGLTVSPRGSLVYTPWDHHTFRASIGSAFRNPTIFENFLLAELPTGLPPPGPATARIEGNRDLEPEELVSFELGYQALLFKRFKARLDLFYSRFVRSIELEPVNPLGPPVLSFVDRDGGRILGGEVGLEVLIAEGVRGFGNYSYQDRNGADPGVLGMVPRHKANLGFHLSLKNGFSANLLLHYVGESHGASGRLGAYMLVNPRLAQRFKVLGHEVEAALQAFNLLNDVHRELPGGDLLERRVSGTLRFRF